MTWVFVGSIIPQEGEWLKFPLQFASNLNLLKISYGSIYDEIDDGYAWIRSFYPTLNSYSGKWRKIFPKSQEEIFYLFEDIFFPDSIKSIEIKKRLYQSYKSVSRASLNWSVSLYVWDTPIVVNQKELETISYQLSNIKTELELVSNNLINLPNATVIQLANAISNELQLSLAQQEQNLISEFTTILSGVI